MAIMSNTKSMICWPVWFYAGLRSINSAISYRVLAFVALMLFCAPAHPGAIVGWGADGEGQLSGIPAGSGFKAIAGRGNGGYALRADGSIASWGYDGYGEVSS